MKDAVQNKLLHLWPNLFLCVGYEASWSILATERWRIWNSLVSTAGLWRMKSASQVLDMLTPKGRELTTWEMHHHSLCSQCRYSTEGSRWTSFHVPHSVPSWTDYFWHQVWVRKWLVICCRIACHTVFVTGNIIVFIIDIHGYYC